MPSNDTTPTGYIKRLEKMIRQAHAERRLFGADNEDFIEDLLEDLGQARRRLKEDHQDLSELGELMVDMIDNTEDPVFQNVYRPMAERLTRTGRSKAAAIGPVPEKRKTAFDPPEPVADPQEPPVKIRPHKTAQEIIGVRPTYDEDPHPFLDEPTAPTLTETLAASKGQNLGEKLREGDLSFKHSNDKPQDSLAEKIKGDKNGTLF